MDRALMPEELTEVSVFLPLLLPVPAEVPGPLRPAAAAAFTAAPLASTAGWSFVTNLPHTRILEGESTGAYLAFRAEAAEARLNL
jgi:hypothetical protein